MPFANDIDRKDYARSYYRKNADRIKERRAERSLWKQLAEDDDRRGRASAALDAVVSELSDAELDVVYGILNRCTQLMLDELVGRARKLT